MKQETIAVTIFFLFLTVTGLVGAVPLTLSIVATYGLTLRVVRRRNVGRRMATTVVSCAVGALAIPLLGLLVYLWGVTVGLSFPWSLVAWSAIIVSAEAWAGLVTWWEHHKGAVGVLLLDSQEPA